MAKIEIDTARVKECGDDIMQAAIELNDEINSLFDRIQSVPYRTMEWVGPAAELYASNIMKEKIKYINLKNCIYNMGRFLVDSANEIEYDINRF